MNPIRNVLCPVDFTRLSERALQLAVEMCKRTGAHLVLHHNLDSRPPDYLTVRWMWSEDHEPSEKEHADSAPEMMRALFRRIPEGISHEAKITQGPIDVGLLEVARVVEADAIVMGTHGPSTVEHHSLTERVILQSPCPVLVAGESYRPESVFDERGEPPETMSVLLPYDFTPHSQEALEFAKVLVRHMPHRLQLLHVTPSDSGDSGEIHDRLAALVPDDLADRTDVEVVSGHPVEEILGAARRIEALFIVMGAHGKSVFKRFLFGATTISVLHGSACPVLFVPRALAKHRPAWSTDG